MTPAPSRFVVVTGTGTEIGKTYVTAAVARALRARGVAVEARKPVLSFDPSDTAPLDADVLADATGEPSTRVCPEHRRLALAMAPPMAAEALALPPFTISDLVTELTPADTDDAIVFVEGAGGVRSPLAADGDSATLVDLLDPALVVLVADAGLGTINSVRMSVAALPHDRVVVHLNRYDETNDLHRRNRDWLAARDRFEVVTDLDTLTDRVAARARR
jgi:dethiobiotin synthetase